ncbi:MAG: hypothetical protein ACRD4Q_13380, partial [Candidatus Acidiferrales bacterium]
MAPPSAPQNMAAMASAIHRIRNGMPPHGNVTGLNLRGRTARRIVRVYSRTAFAPRAVPTHQCLRAAA